MNNSILSFPSPAKLNLFLYINGRRKDGYHELQTLFQFLDFGDTLNISVRTDSNIIVSPEIKDLKVEDNLIYRAAKLLQKETQCQLGANIHLNKVLPMGGGVGGGSSNAATTLVALNYLWNTQLSLDKLAQLGLKLGADVPIFIYGKSSFAEGVGEKFIECYPSEKWYVVLKPEVSISTAKIFNSPNLKRDTPKRTLEQCLNQSYENDCEKVVLNCYPEVEETLMWLLQYGPARLTGTGACVFAEFNDEESAKKCLHNKPEKLFGFVAKGENYSPLHQYLNKLVIKKS